MKHKRIASDLNFKFSLTLKLFQTTSNIFCRVFSQHLSSNFGESN